MPQRTWVSSLPFGPIAGSSVPTTESGRFFAPPPYSLGTAEERMLDAIRCRLRSSSNESNALEAIREIGADLLGSQEMGLYKVDDEKGVLWLYWSFGIDPEKYRMLDALSEPVLRQVIEGEIIIDGRVSGTGLNGMEKEKSAHEKTENDEREKDKFDNDDWAQNRRKNDSRQKVKREKNDRDQVKPADADKKVTAFVPILFNGRTVAILAIFRLHPEKNGIDRTDLEIFHVLSSEAGKALFDSTKPFLTRLLEDRL